MHALSVRREEINIVAGRGAQKDKMSPRHTEGQNESAAHRRTKRVRLCLAGVLYDRQVHPDQTKAVKGQSSKTLVTTGTIKRPLPCPVKGIEKQRIFHNVKRKTE